MKDDYCYYCFAKPCLDSIVAFLFVIINQSFKKTDEFIINYLCASGRLDFFEFENIIKLKGFPGLNGFEECFKFFNGLILFLQGNSTHA